MEVIFEPVTQATVLEYIKVGQQSYKEHYLHLWENRDPKSYIATSFTEVVLQTEMADPNCENYLIKYNGTSAGVLKISINKGWGHWTDAQALYFHRIYILNAFSGRGIGKAALGFATRMAESLNKSIIWLEAMKKGKALGFYQKNGFEIEDDVDIALKGIQPSEKEMWVMVKRL